ncbi:uncharacterized protein LOC126995155 [Eriocheir sinensis]|uniref:uncharacterized protein LOC126995155 n=1 Tax=Eriocheir sinensis TaxID=95602 RepID=UPI0021C91D45|nr:uncharacterized protein LOC126995155 [Eriocheir sinensis]
MLRRLKSLGVPALKLATTFKIFILPKLTFASPAWSPCLTTTQLGRLERVQKRAVKIILGTSYTTYDIAFATLHLTTLAAQYTTSLEQFGLKLLNNSCHRDLLSLNAPHHHHNEPYAAPTS